MLINFESNKNASSKNKSNVRNKSHSLPLVLKFATQMIFHLVTVPVSDPARMRCKKQIENIKCDK